MRAARVQYLPVDGGEHDTVRDKELIVDISQFGAEDVIGKESPMPFQTKFWFRADAVISAESKADAWRRIAQLANNDADGHPTPAGFLAGGMSVEADGQHLTGPATMTGTAEDALVALYHKKVIEQGERLTLDEIPDPVYSMMIGFAIAHDLRAEDAKKLAQRLYHGQEEAGDQKANG
jgi:hypothetical protein